MPFPPRDYAPGIHHAWVNATGSEPYYRDDVDRVDWLRRLVVTIQRYDWTCIAFCQLTTHVHLLLSVPNESLPRGMQHLNRSYSRAFNARHDRGGQFVRRRYSNRRVGGTTDLLRTFAYVVLNAELAGACRATEFWRWGSYPTTLGIRTDFPFVDASLVLAELGGSRDSLRALVNERREYYLSQRAMSRYQIPGHGLSGR